MNISDRAPKRQSSGKFDERGQIFILAIFASLMLIFCFFLIFNTGMFVLEKMKLQNAADSAAQSAALWQARGLNIEGHLNTAQEALTISYLAALAAVQPATAYKIQKTSEEISKLQETIDKNFPNMAIISAVSLSRKNKADFVFLNGNVNSKTTGLCIRKKNNIPLIINAFTIYELDIPDYWSPQERKGPFVSFTAVKKMQKNKLIFASSSARPKFKEETAAPEGKVRAGWRAVLISLRQ